MTPFLYAGERDVVELSHIELSRFFKNFSVPVLKSSPCWPFRYHFIVDKVFWGYLHTSFCNTARTEFGGIEIHSDGVSE